MSRKSAFSIFLIFVIFLSSCGVVRTKYASLQYASRSNDTGNPDFRDDVYLYELADRFGLMAHFAQVVYRDDLVTKSKEYADSGELKSVRVLGDDMGSACNYLSPNVALPTYGMPYIMPADESYREGMWSRWRGSDAVESEPCYNKQGLFFETYVYVSEGLLREAVIAYRGTENNGSQFWHDWRSNLASVFGFEPEQYKIAADKLPRIIEALKAENPEVQIYATGHSLGGGLAQQAGYLSKDIKEVFTFNTSPVTNWTSLALKGKVQNAYPIFHRIYNGGEVLGGIRSVTTSFTKARYGRHDIGIQVKPKKPIAGHSMTLLSCHFACLIENSDKVAQHNFTPEYIRRELMAEGGVCGGYVDFDRCELSIAK